ncbi:MAG: glutamyl-tRNA amidotransferase [Candidatus Omnitrophica bacterium]|nr:glutamyl-tRNA amidotransferase [Candidatus Omnitrophota bacterium]
MEDIIDGRKIVITKPGGKFSFGILKRDDFMVWIHDPKKDTLWLISHKNIFEDLEEKAMRNKKEALRIIEALAKVYKGSDPDIVLKKMKLRNPFGEKPEVLLKAYKWIWGQEDCNYPPPKYKGREMSMNGINELKNRLKR